MRRCLAALAAVLAATAAHGESPVDRGDYLVNGILACGNCHTPRGPDGRLDTTRALSGGPLVFEEPGFRVLAPNITPDPETGIGRWSDAEIKAAIRDGVRPDGSRLAPVMPYPNYHALTPGDLDAVVAYLRALKPVRNAVEPPRYTAPMPALPGAAPVQAAELKDPVKRGFYLATLGHCLLCHTPKIKDGLDMTRRGAGGHSFEGPWGVSVSRNITAHPEAGLGKWSDAEIKAAITQGRRPDGTALSPPMPFASYARMTDQDLDAIVAYLRTLPPRE